jgi:hypothetical protein
MDGYISKPIRPDVLFASLAEHAGTPSEAPFVTARNRA